MKTRTLALAGIILVAAATRLLPHPYNFAPITAVALFGGAQFRRRREAFLLPLAAMFLSDLFLGFHAQVAVVYSSFLLIALIGRALRENRTSFRIAGGTVAGSLLFFILTNFGVWLWDGLYPRTAEGLLVCYTAAIPFLHNTLLGDAVYAAVLFGGFALAERWLPVLRESAMAAEARAQAAPV